MTAKDHGVVLRHGDGPWQVTFDPVWGGPDGPVVFAGLTSWTDHESDGIKYYSGIAVCRKTFDCSERAIGKVSCLDLGQVEDMARVTLNGRDLGVVWSAPYRVNIPAEVLKRGNNELEIEVVNTWHNRLVGDMQPGNQGVRELA